MSSAEPWWTILQTKLPLTKHLHGTKKMPVLELRRNHILYYAKSAKYWKSHAEPVTKQPRVPSRRDHFELKKFLHELEKGGCLGGNGTSFLIQNKALLEGAPSKQKVTMDCGAGGGGGGARNSGTNKFPKTAAVFLYSRRKCATLKANPQLLRANMSFLKQNPLKSTDS